MPAGGPSTTRSQLGTTTTEQPSVSRRLTSRSRRCVRTTGQHVLISPKQKLAGPCVLRFRGASESHLGVQDTEDEGQSDLTDVDCVEIYLRGKSSNGRKSTAIRAWSQKQVNP